MRDVPTKPSIAAIILAAGKSSRAAPINKLLIDIDGAPLITRSLDAAVASQADPIIVVIGHAAHNVQLAIAGYGIRTVENADFECGMSTSLRAGIRSLPPGCDGAVILLADMPRVSAEHIDRLIDAFNTDANRGICVASHGGRRGNPVLWGARHFNALAAAQGDSGGRALLAKHADDVFSVEMADEGVLFDADTPEALAELVGGRVKSSP